MSDIEAIKIMIVDDEPDMETLIRQKFRKKIRKNEYEFFFAHNGLEALSALIENPDINLILSDINMPEMDGLTLLTKINEMKNPALKTVMVSAYGDMENIRTAMNRGAFDFVTKPINFEDLEITINKTLNHIKVLKQASHEHEQLISIQHDLSVAKEIQQSILPQVFPAYPGRSDFDLHASMNAAKSIGGDFYDFFLIDEDHLGIVMADVSDKGIPAAIYMAVSRTVIRAAALKGLRPGECMEYSNSLLCKESVNDMFVTVFYGILELSSGSFSYANGGHNPPYIIGSNGGCRVIEKTGGLVLGVMEDMKYKENTIKIAPSEKIFTFTDGVTEAMNIANELYGEERLEALLAGLSEKNPKELIAAVSEDLKAFTAGAKQSDDITMLAVDYISR